MNTRFFLSMTALGLLLGGCCQHHHTAAARPAATTSQNNRYELASRVSDPLANYGAGTSAGIPNDATTGRYPGRIEPLVTPLMAFGN